MQILDQKTGELGFTDFGDALVAYVAVHDSSVEATNADPQSEESRRLRESERAAAETVLRFCLAVGRELIDEKSRPMAGRPDGFE